MESPQGVQSLSKLVNELPSSWVGRVEQSGATEELSTSYQVLLRYMEVASFKTFRDREIIDFCPGWTPSDKEAETPLTVVFGGNGAGKSAVFDAVLFVLGQRSSSLRTTKAMHLINDQTVQDQGADATASIEITFQRIKQSSGTRGRELVARASEVTADGGDDDHVEYFSVGRAVRHGAGSSSFSAQGKCCSRAEMMEALSAFVGADMSNVDRYVLKQGSTMIFHRGNQDLLAFMENLAGTVELREAIEQTQDALEDSREEAQRTRVEAAENAQSRNRLQSQVDALFEYHRAASEVVEEEVILGHRRLALGRLESEIISTTILEAEKEMKAVMDGITSARKRSANAEKALSRASKEMGERLSAQAATRRELQMVKVAHAQAEALAKMNLESIRSKRRALTRARKLLQDGDEETERLSAMTDTLNVERERVLCRIEEFRSQHSAINPDEWSKLEDLQRELNFLDSGHMAELERAVKEREQRILQVHLTLSKLLEDSEEVRRRLTVRDADVTASRDAIEALQTKIETIGRESAEVQANCASQEALANSLSDRLNEGFTHARVFEGPHGEAQPGASGLTRGVSRHSDRKSQDRVNLLRALVTEFRECRGLHGMLADIVVLREERDSTAVVAVLGSALHDTIVVQSREDGSRLVARARAEGIRGRIRCDVLDEMKGTISDQRPVLSGLRSLSGRVTTLDPRLLPAVEKHVRGWLLADTRQGAWAARKGADNAVAANIVTTAGELFYRGGEVAVKARGGSSSSRFPPLAVVGKSEKRRAPQPLRDNEKNVHEPLRDEDMQCVRKSYNEAEAILAKMKERMRDLTRDGTQARFELEDAQARLTKQQAEVHRLMIASGNGSGSSGGSGFTQNGHFGTPLTSSVANESRDELARLEKKVAIQRHSVSVRELQREGDEEVELSSLRTRRNGIVEELTRMTEKLGGREETARVCQDDGNLHLGELQRLKSELEANDAAIDESRMKLRVLIKRRKERADRVADLVMEVEALQGGGKEVKGRLETNTERVSTLVADLEDVTAHYKVARKSAREAEGLARKAQLELDAMKAPRVELSARRDNLVAEKDRARSKLQKIARHVAKDSRIAHEATSLMQPALESDAHQETGDEERIRRLERLLAFFTGEAFSETQVGIDCSEAEERESGRDSAGEASGIPTTNSNRIVGCIKARAGKRTASEHTDDGDADGQHDLDLEVLEAPALTPLGVPQEIQDRETRLTELAREIVEGDRQVFIKDTGAMEASIRLKKATVRKLRGSVDATRVSEAISLDWKAAELQRKVERAQTSLTTLADKKEALEAERHTTLVRCLNEVNRALGNIFRWLTSTEGGSSLQCSQGVTQAVALSAQDGGEGMFATGRHDSFLTGGDCFLHFSPERTLLLSEGLAIQAKPDASSPWRGPGQLSGGQVALVGLALNLAMQAVRPAPLYLMDEIDSALDSQKVRRIATMFADRGRLGKEQRIVISHRPEMHERASHLLGVYNCMGTARSVELSVIQCKRQAHRGASG